MDKHDPLEVVPVVKKANCLPEQVDIHLRVKLSAYG